MKVILKCAKCGHEHFDNLSPDQSLKLDSKLKCSQCGFVNEYNDLKNDAIKRALEELPTDELNSLFTHRKEIQDPNVVAMLKKIVNNVKNK